jgi:phosphohistidine phosphatase
VQHCLVGSEMCIRDRLYHADEKTFYDVIEKMEDEFSSIALFSHNPGITSFVNELTKTQIDDMPTCGIFAVEIDCKKWNEFKKAKKKFLFFDYPKA